MSEEKKPVKVRLAAKWAKVWEQEVLESDGFANVTTVSPSTLSQIERAYLAGFDRAKALCVDHIQRTVGEDRAKVLEMIGENV